MAAEKPNEKKVTPRSTDFAGWYNDVILRAELADYSPVRGSMVFRPDGFGIWELLRDELDRRIKKTGARNAYFPMFIPQSLLEKEAKHVEGFAPEVAVVTHGGGKLLEEPLIVRPTSETIINHMFAQWIHSHRDLPMMVNQWCNVVRWEMRTRLFLRTLEFLWQEGHTAHVSRHEAERETLTMLEVYRQFVEDFLAIPLIVVRKSAAERFPGADETYTIEGLMWRTAARCNAAPRTSSARISPRPSRSASSMRAISFSIRGRRVGEFRRACSAPSLWCMATIRACGFHPQWRPRKPSLCRFRANPKKRRRLSLLRAIRDSLDAAGVRVKIDEREGVTPGFKFNDLEMRGIPVRIEIGPRDVASGEVVLARRDRLGPEAKQKAPIAEVAARVTALLAEIQRSLFDQARAYRDANTREFADYTAFVKQMEGEGGGGMAHVYWCGNPACEIKIREETKATCRAIPLNQNGAPGKCIVCGESATERAFFAKAY